MILGRLLTALFAAGVVFVMTSNYPPDGLYPNGLQRRTSCPTIAAARATGSTWSRSTAASTTGCARSSRCETFHVPRGRRTPTPRWRARSSAMRAGPDEDPRLAIEGRTLAARRRAGSAVWFDFAALCDGPRSQRDYLELAQRFAVVFLSGIPRMSAAQGDHARRFTWLVDILYDHRVKLVASAAAPAADALRRRARTRRSSRAP